MSSGGGSISLSVCLSMWWLLRMRSSGGKPYLHPAVLKQRHPHALAMELLYIRSLSYRGFETARVTVVVRELYVMMGQSLCLEPS